MCFLSTRHFKMGARGPESRQKPREMPVFVYPTLQNGGARSRKQTKTGRNACFCLPDTSKSGCAVPKADKKREKCLFLSTRHFKIGVRGPESRQKTGEMCVFCLPDTSKLGSRNRSQVQRLSGCCAALHLAKRAPCINIKKYRTKSGANRPTLFGI